MEILSIEEHNTFLLHSMMHQKVVVKKGLPARKKLINKLCTFNASKFIRHTLFSTCHH